MPDLSHLWQRFLLTGTLFAGLLIGVVSTVFGYDNKTAVSLHLWVLQVDNIPLWSVAVVPVAVTLIASTLYNWMDGLHHFTEHMRHRRRVHELETEVKSLREHLDHVLEMPGHGAEGDKRPRPAKLPAPEEGITHLGPSPPDDLSDLVGDETPRLEAAVAPKPAAEVAPKRPSKNAAKRLARKKRAVTAPIVRATLKTAGAMAKTSPVAGSDGDALEPERERRPAALLRKR